MNEVPHSRTIEHGKNNPLPVSDSGGWPSLVNPRLSILAPGWKEQAVRLLFPARCIFCETVLQVDAGLLVCEPCRLVTQPEEPVWQRCPDWPELDAWYSPFPYAGGVEHAIRQMKYNGQPRHALTLSFLMAQALLEMGECPRFSALIPVPMHPRKQRARGYNQAALLADGMAALLRTPLLTDCIGKARRTPPQNGQDREARLRAVRGTFAPYEQACLPESGTILLIDDVTTTGSTLRACASAIRLAWERQAGLAECNPDRHSGPCPGHDSGPGSGTFSIEHREKQPSALRIYAMTTAFA